MHIKVLVEKSHYNSSVQPLNHHLYMHAHILAVQTFKHLIWTPFILEGKVLSPCFICAWQYIDGT